MASAHRLSSTPFDRTVRRETFRAFQGPHPDPSAARPPRRHPALIDHFLKRSCERFQLRSLGIPSTAIENYSSYDWPGNVAELAMMIERAVSIASAAKFDGTTLPEHFCSPPSLTVPEGGRLKNISLRELIADIEKRIIVQTLDGSTETRSGRRRSCASTRPPPREDEALQDPAAVRRQRA
jgi:transcriptional regulator with AAA-type ATPase domain